MKSFVTALPFRVAKMLRLLILAGGLSVGGLLLLTRRQATKCTFGERFIVSILVNMPMNKQIILVGGILNIPIFASLVCDRRPGTEPAE